MPRTRFFSACSHFFEEYVTPPWILFHLFFIEQMEIVEPVKQKERVRTKQKISELENLSKGWSMNFSPVPFALKFDCPFHYIFSNSKLVSNSFIFFNKSILWTFCLALKIRNHFAFFSFQIFIVVHSWASENHSTIFQK